MTHNETMFGLIENIQTAIEHAHRIIELHVDENGALDRFTEEYLTRARKLAEALADAPGPLNDRAVLCIGCGEHHAASERAMKAVDALGNERERQEGTR